MVKNYEKSKGRVLKDSIVSHQFKWNGDSNENFVIIPSVLEGKHLEQIGLH